MIPVNTPWFDGNEKKYLSECIDSGWISSEGPFVKEFEHRFADSVSRTNGIAVCNGSAALDCALQALEIPPGSEIIVPASTIISCISCILRINCIPVLIDCCPDTWNMDVSQVESKITVKTKAIMVVHLYGLPVDMDPILHLAETHELVVIEDAAQEHGQLYKNKPVGSFGIISIFSFYANKNITTGEGGMIVTNDDRLAERCRSIRNLCFLPHKRFYHQEQGHNFRMSNLQAAVGLAQLEQSEKFLCKKRTIGRYYHEWLHDIPQLQVPVVETHFATNMYWVFGLVLTGEAGITAEVALKRLRNLGVDGRPFFYPMHKQPVFQRMGLFKNDTYPVAERLGEQGFYIPSGLGISLCEQEEVVKHLRSIFE